MHPTRTLLKRLATLSPLLLALPAHAALQLGSPFSDHMVLQRGGPVPVWGTTAPGGEVLVSFANQQKSARADSVGRWRVNLDPLTANATPRTLVATARKGADAGQKIEVADVLVGEVWLCGGQSNMERQLGPRPPQKDIIGAAEAAAAADYPLVRQLYVKQSTQAAPQTAATMSWTVCTPRAALDFTAVGFFFARDLHLKLGVPVGIINSTWGGTPAEAWTSVEGLKDFPEFQGDLDNLAAAAADPEGARVAIRARADEWYRIHDTGSSPEAPWTAPALNTDAWQPVTMPATWETLGRSDFDGVTWLRHTFDLPDSWQGGDVELHLGLIDDADTTWVNGREVGRTEAWDALRIYRVPGSALKKQGNILAVRVLDSGGGGGFFSWDPNQPYEIRALDGAFSPVSLRGPWLARFATELWGAGGPPPSLRQGPGVPTVLYNGMIAPVAPYALRGFTFYQGEANAGRHQQYRKLLPAMITDWRHQWGDPSLPFLFVQVAPFKHLDAFIREAQFLAWQETPRTAMAVTIDCGDAEDIHPADKAPVGARLALAARALAYGESIEYSGPVFSRLETRSGRAVLGFKHLGGGLVAKDGPLVGFTVAGADGVFHPAEAGIVGDTVEVSSINVKQPKHVRYGWANVASGNLFNRAGLPASPFRSDTD